MPIPTPPVTRAKFRCTSETRYGYNSDTAREYRFTAVSDNSTPENERYAKYTPVGQLTITVDNPNVQFELNGEYYLDFTPAS